MPSSHFGQLKIHPGFIEDLLSKSLFDPLHEFLARPRKSLRSQLIQAGYDLATVEAPGESQRDLILRAGQAIEALHAGSLILDDIEDDSETRRGAPCLHLDIGSPLAMNAGNWLYFFSYHLIENAEASVLTKSLCMKEITDSLLKAHQGQALDLSINMKEIPIYDAPLICRQSLEWKSGSLFELGFVLGGRIAGCEGSRLESLRMLGRELGVTVQMFNDLKGLEAHGQPDSKHFQELRQGRPSFAWWLLAEDFPDQWDDFAEAVALLPQSESLQSFLTTYPILQKGRARALGHQQWAFQTFATLGGDLTTSAFERVQEIAEKIAA